MRERRYSLTTVAHAIKTAPYKCARSGKSLGNAIIEGTLTGNYSYNKGKKIAYCTVRDVQSYLGRTQNAVCQEWVLKNLLDLSADEIVLQWKGDQRVSTAAAMQKHLDRESME